MKTNTLYLIVAVVFSLNVSCSQKTEQETAITKKQDEKSLVPFELYVPSNQDYLGVYLPDRYIEQLKTQKSHSRTIHSHDANYYSLLSVHPDIIYTDAKWHDGFAIEKKNGDKFVFYEEKGSQKIKDENGFSYTQLSKDYQHAYEIIRIFIVKTLFSDMILQGIATESEVGITIMGHDFRVILDDMFFPKSFDALIYEKLSGKTYGVTFSDTGAKYNLLLDNDEDIEMLIGPEVELN